MEYTCKICGDRSDRKLLRKEMLCNKCGGDIYADPAKLKAANRKLSIFCLVGAIIMAFWIIYG